ncbi:MAG: deoxynucleoside kinase [Bacteroidales bacterium]|jgi:deoxyadenosine/deoxycytidine kinase|nr:deoxynucleoside kinase [Bacteroidales bacterium]MBQ2376366.1 deoxynucleoside kinase [Bacteroidales bacterium]MBQ2398238.1 deoxynucleoside kinase [Bacteroidales bacterium]MBQ5874201.1 deoxynucleoside kinase [Bacteroidales bacterium]MBQ5891851.1 deoxynucleoside kinase [Bacteroidales bacterium]
MHIAIAGNIGSGKTTLTELLAKHFKWTPIYEQMDDNPYIANFYEDMRRWSFNLQVYFLHKRFKYVIDSRNTYDNIVQDRTLYEDAYIFAPNLHAMGLMNTRDFETYKSLFDLMESFIKPPDLLIYLKASVPTLIQQIEKRGREYESSIRLDYITSLNNRYNSWIEEYSNRKLIINMDDLNITENPKDLGFVVDSINAEINGLF